MARKIEPEETIADLHDELDYTESRLLDEEEGVAALNDRLEPSRVELAKVEAEQRQLARQEAQVQANLDGANRGLDEATDEFAADLLRDVKSDRTSSRWRAIFRDQSPTEFKRMPLPDQAKSIRGWLTDSTDPALAPHRDRLERQTARAERAIARDGALSAKRGNLWRSREALATLLTRERDALEDTLAELGRTQGRERTWPRSFFKVGARPKKGPTGGGTPTT